MKSCVALIAFLAFIPSWASGAENNGLPPETFLAKRGSGQISLGDVDAAAAEMPPEVRRGFFENPNRVEATLSNLLLIKQLTAEAHEAGLDKDPELQGRIRLATERLIATAWIKRVAEQAPKLDAEKLAKESYLADPKRFVTPDAVVTRHVLIKIGGARSDEASKALAEKIRADALAGKDFEQLANAYNEDEGSKKTGGLLPPIQKGQTQPPFEEAAFALDKPGAISAVVKTEYGYHVIKLIERQPSRKRSFDEVKTELAKKLAAEHAERYKKEHADQLQSMSLDVNDAALSTMATRYAGEPVPKDASSPAPKAGADKAKH